MVVSIRMNGQSSNFGVLILTNVICICVKSNLIAHIDVPIACWGPPGGGGKASKIKDTPKSSAFVGRE